MADLKNTRYIVKHVDGVMHLIQAPQGNVAHDALSASAQPKAAEMLTESKK